MSTATAEKKASKNGAASEATEKKTVKRRTAQDIMQHKNKGVLILMTQAAFKVAKANSFAGIEVTIEDENGKEKKVALKDNFEESTISGIGYTLTKEGGKIIRLSEDSKEYKSLIEKAKKAKPALEEDKYTADVKAFMNELLSIEVPQAPRSSGAVLKGISFE